MYLCGASQADVDIYLTINVSERPGEWRRVFDTALAGPDDVHEPGGEPAGAPDPCPVGSGSVVGLVRGGT